MRTLKFAFLVLFALTSAALLLANAAPQAEFISVRDYAIDDLDRLSEELRVSQLLLSFDPLGVAPDIIPRLGVPVPVLIGLTTALGFFVGLLLAAIWARKLRRELREKRDETILLKAELHRARQTLKESDHPASALPGAPL